MNTACQCLPSSDDAAHSFGSIGPFRGIFGLEDGLLVIPRLKNGTCFVHCLVRCDQKHLHQEGITRLEVTRSQ